MKIFCTRWRWKSLILAIQQKLIITMLRNAQVKILNLSVFKHS